MENQGFNINRPSVINLINAAAYNKALAVLKKSFDIHILDGKNITNKESFFNEFTKQILEHGTANNLANFQDLFFQFLVEKPKRQTVFIWTNTDNMLNGQLEDLIRFSDILTTISRKLNQDGHEHINIFFGEGANFPHAVQLE